jgi:hypothetical protein
MRVAPWTMFPANIAKSSSCSLLYFLSKSSAQTVIARKGSCKSWLAAKANRSRSWFGSKWHSSVEARGFPVSAAQLRSGRDLASYVLRLAQDYVSFIYLDSSSVYGRVERGHGRTNLAKSGNSWL